MSQEKILNQRFQIHTIKKFLYINDAREKKQLTTVLDTSAKMARRNVN